MGSKSLVFNTSVPGVWEISVMGGKSPVVGGTGDSYYGR